MELDKPRRRELTEEEILMHHPLGSILMKDPHEPLTHAEGEKLRQYLKIILELQQQGELKKSSLESINL